MISHIDIAERDFNTATVPVSDVDRAVSAVNDLRLRVEVASLSRDAYVTIQATIRYPSGYTYELNRRYNRSGKHEFGVWLGGLRTGDFKIENCWIVSVGDIRASVKFISFEIGEGVEEWIPSYDSDAEDAV